MISVLNNLKAELTKFIGPRILVFYSVNFVIVYVKSIKYVGHCYFPKFVTWPEAKTQLSHFLVIVK